MATTVITAVQMAVNVGDVITPGAGTAIVAADTMKVLYPREGKLLIIVDSDNAATQINFTETDQFTGKLPASQALQFAVGNTVMSMIMVESDRHKANDGHLIWIWAASSAGFVRVFLLPVG